MAVPEGLSTTEAGRGLAEHAERDEEERERRLNRTVSIIEASLLAVVAVLAAWSGYAAAKWSTESSLRLAKALGTTAQLWLNLQNDYDVQIAKRHLGKVLDRIERVNRPKAA